MPSLFFLIPTSTVHLKPFGELKTLIGGKQRIDVLARCLLNIYRWKERLEESITLIFYLANEEEKAIHIPLEEVDFEIKGELDALDTVINVLNEREEKIKIEQIAFSNLLDKLNIKSNFYYLTPEGTNIEVLEKQDKTKNKVFILGSQEDIPTEYEKELSQYSAILLSLGKKEYLASHVITILCDKIRKGF